MNSTHSETGTESYNSARLRVDGGHADLFLSRYATSGRRLPEKEQMLWTPPQAWVHHTGILTFSHQALYAKLWQPKATPSTFQIVL